MGKIKNKPIKAELLKDLERIHDSLREEEEPMSDEESALDEDTIPLLTQSVDVDKGASCTESKFKSESEFYDHKLIFDEDAGQMVDEMARERESEANHQISTDEALLKAAYRETLADAEDFLDEQSKMESEPDNSGVFEVQQSLFEDSGLENSELDDSGLEDSGLEDSELEGSGFDDSGFVGSEGVAETDDIYQTGVREAIHVSDLNPDRLPTAQGENPFLPKHVRERLDQGKSSFMEEIAQVSESLSKFNSPSGVRPEIILPATPRSAGVAQGDPGDRASPQGSTYASAQHEQLIDALVAEYLPKIEAELRQKLKKTLVNKSQ